MLSIKLRQCLLRIRRISTKKIVLAKKALREAAEIEVTVETNYVQPKPGPTPGPTPETEDYKLEKS